MSVSDKISDLFKSELGGEVEKVLIDCPHCEKGLSKAQLMEAIEKAKKSKGKGGAKGSSVHQNTNPHVGAPGNRVGTVRNGPGGTGQKGDVARPGVYKADVPVEETKKVDAPAPGPRYVGGSQWHSWVDTGEDKRVADMAAQGSFGEALVNRPPHVGRRS